jgi:hypothetical protein
LGEKFGPESVLMTLTSYGNVNHHRQAQIIRSTV